MELYKKLFKEIVLSNFQPRHIFIEISPEQEISTVRLQENLLKIYNREIIRDLSHQVRYFHFYYLND